MLYRGVRIVNGETTEPVSFVGVHPVRWKDRVDPTIGFVVVADDEGAEALRAAGDELAADAEALISHWDKLHPIDRQRLAESLRRWREVTGEGK